jgi:hypothetical protein
MMELGCKEQVHNHLMYATLIQILPLISTNYQIKVFSRLLCVCVREREREKSHMLMFCIWNWKLSSNLTKTSIYLLNVRSNHVFYVTHNGIRLPICRYKCAEFKKLN